MNVFHKTFQEREYTKSTNRDQSCENEISTRSRKELSTARCGLGALAGVNSNKTVEGRQLMIYAGFHRCPPVGEGSRLVTAFHAH